LSVYAPIPTHIAPKTKRKSPALTGPGICGLDTSIVPQLGTTLIANNIFVHREKADMERTNVVH
jgi:hypothetical protein